MKMLACCFAAAMAVFSATAGNEPHRKGEFALTFTETDPRGEMKEMLRRKFPELEINDKGIDKDTGYAVDSRTFEVVVPESYDPKVPAPLFVWVSAGMSGKVEANLRSSLAKRGIIYVGPNRAGNDVYPPHRYRAAMDAVLNMKKLYNVNPSQIYFGGNSGGGRTASMGCIIYPEIFTGGGYYVIGCDFWEYLTLPDGKRSWGFCPKIDKKFLTEAKGHAYVFLTGTDDFNREGTDRAYKAYLKAGFKNCFYNETKGLGHAMPPAEDIEKSFQFLEQYLFADAYAAAAQAEKLIKSRSYSQAVKKLEPFRGRCAAVDAAWDGLVTKADADIENAVGASKLKPSLRISKLKQVGRTFGSAAADRVKKEIETIESSPEYQAELEEKARSKKKTKK